jgi:mannose-6-phosphate isomerase-like protein (cupin superfamily)
MDKLVRNIEKETLENNFFRKVLLTTSHQQLVVMHLNPLEDIGMETHNTLDQFIKIENGEGKAILNGEEFVFSQGFSITIPAGTKHNIINTSNENPIKLYTVYSPPNHKDGTIHKNRQEALENEEHYEA